MTTPADNDDAPGGPTEDFQVAPPDWQGYFAETQPLEIGERLSPIATSPLYVNVDVNDLLLGRTEAEVIEFLGKLKDLFEPKPLEPAQFDGS